ncbi:hypothetical protein [Gordonia terrae]
MQFATAYRRVGWVGAPRPPQAPGATQGASGQQVSRAQARRCRDSFGSGSGKWLASLAPQDCRTHGIACARLIPDEGTSMPCRIAALGNHDAATLTGYLEVCDDQWEHWQSMVNTARLAGADPRTIRLYDAEAAYWSRFAEMLRVAIAEVEASNRRAGRRRTA